MIESKEELKEYLKADRKRYPIKNMLKAYLTYHEYAVIWRYIKTLRYYEYYVNLYEKKSSYIHLVMKMIYKLRWKKKCLKTGMTIYPNTCGKGLYITHLAFIMIPENVRIGKNCSILPMVLLGKNGKVGDGLIEIGDSVQLSAGCIVLGPCKIGSNCVVGAGAVVNKDFPDGSHIAGVPAKIISVRG